MRNIVVIMNGFMLTFVRYESFPTNIIGLISSFQHGNDEKLQQYLQDGLCRIRLQKANTFDISALLLRPIQRIVRYPLILNELFKVNTNRKKNLTRRNKH